MSDLAAQSEIKYACLRDSSIELYFKHMADIEQTFYVRWKEMSLGSTSAQLAYDDDSGQYAGEQKNMTLR